MIRGQEAVSKILHTAGGHLATMDDHVAGKVLAEGSKTVGDPSAHARAAGEHVTAVEGVIGVGVIRRKRGHRTDDAEVIRAGADVRKQIADGEAAFSVAVEFPRTFQEVAVVVEDRGIDGEFGRLAVLFGELRFGVEAVDLRHATVHVEEDDMFGARCEVRHLGIERRG